MSGLVLIRARPICLIVVLIGLISGCTKSGSEFTGVNPANAITPAAAAAGPAGGSAAPAISATDSPTAESRTAKPTKKPGKPARTSSATGAGLSAADRLAGLRSATVVWKGGGHLISVPGRSVSPGKGRIYTVQVEVESGLDVDRTAFAKFVLATLNDPRSWTEHGTRRFARSSGRADLRVVLASPATSASMCLPLRTFGKLSCREGANTAVLTYYRWVKAIPEYAGDRTGYRHYVINHEVGHVLGHGHQYCAGQGKLAPLMMQQTKGLKGCRPNPWPHP